MYLSKRSGTLTLVSVAASFLLFGCQSTEVDKGSKTAVAPIVEEASDPVVEIPKDLAAAKPSAAELRELEEALIHEESRKAKGERSLKDQAEAFGLEIARRPQSNEWELSNGSRKLLLKEDSRNATLEGVKVILDAPLGQHRGNWILSESDRKLVLGSWLGQAIPSTRKLSTIVIDPGHGGSQDGSKNLSLGLVEKDLNLDVSIRLQKRLEKLGFKVLLTRYDDRLLSLADRPELANSLRADLFVSVHFNAATNEDANGLETFMLAPAGYPSTSATVVGDDAIAYAGNAFDVENFNIAFRIQKSLLARLGREDRGVKKARWEVLRPLNCPGVLVECGFISNPAEGRLISTAGYRERVAQALTDAISSYAGAVPAL